MAQPDISQILAALAQQNQGAAPPTTSTPQQMPPGQPIPQTLYGLTAQSPPVGSGYLPQPSAQGNVIRPAASGSVSIADAIAKAKSIAADRGVNSYDPRQMRSRSRSRSPRRDGGSNPYRDDRRGDPRRGGGPRSPSPDYRSGSGNYGGGGGGGGSETEQIRVKASLVGLIIGRNGENLRRVEGDSGARVQFVQTKDPHVIERQCNITGPLRAREQAKAMIYQTIEDNGGQNIMSDPASMSASNRTTQAAQPALRDGEETYQMLVPDKTVGLIIGRGGETIKDIQEKSGCHVNIVGENKSINGQRPVNLIGTERSVDLAKQLILEVVSSDNGSKASGLTGTNAVNPSRDRGYDQFGGGNFGGDDDYEEKTIKVPSEAVGMIIGKGGETIKELQRTSGCKINVNQPKPPDLTRNIDLAGTRRSMAAAEKVIWEKVETVRQRDEAAGRPSRNGPSYDSAPSYSNNGYSQPQQSTPSAQGYGAYGMPGAQQNTQNTAQMPYQMPFFQQQQATPQPSQPPAQAGGDQAAAAQMNPALYAQYYAQYMAQLAQQQQGGGQ